jgi:hypothetical protein
MRPQDTNHLIDLSLWALYTLILQNGIRLGIQRLVVTYTECNRVTSHKGVSLAFMFCRVRVRDIGAVNGSLIFEVVGPTTTPPPNRRVLVLLRCAERCARYWMVAVGAGVPEPIKYGNEATVWALLSRLPNSFCRVSAWR